MEEKKVEIGSNAGLTVSVNKQQVDNISFTKYEKGDVKIYVSAGFTITLGNFSSKNISVGMERRCDAGKEDQTFEEIMRWIETKIEEKNEELRAMGKQLISLEINPQILNERQ